ncbi:MAG: hypothetical protein PHW73_04950 [Atribacterota bacterium]|nr:hypothetical protein [Atribacterota bacterium]
MEKKEDQGKTVENLIIQIIKGLNAESPRTEELAKTEKNPNKNLRMEFQEVCKTSMKYKSILIFGTAVILKDMAKKELWIL